MSYPETLKYLQPIIVNSIKPFFSVLTLIRKSSVIHADIRETVEVLMK